MLDDDINPYASPSETDSGAVSAEARVATKTATIVPVPEPYCGRVLTRFHCFGIVTICFVAIIFFFLIGGWVLGSVFHSGLYSIRIVPYKWYIAIPLIIFPIAVPIIGILIFICFQSIVENIYWRWMLYKSIRRRPDPLVSENAHDSAIINIMPRMNWRSLWRADMTRIRDLGLLKLDTERSEVLIESDRERFRIPRGSVLVCEPDVFHEQPGTTSVIGFVRLVIQLEDGTREIRFCLIPTDFKFRTNNAKRLMAQDICQRINSLPMSTT
ncbi:MAG: hypothetical protein JXM70_09985 [Pirellulales bacterium]|nr:hypothetical protein [Pirellulales bacterium]